MVLGRLLTLLGYGQANVAPPAFPGFTPSRSGDGGNRRDRLRARRAFGPLPRPIRYFLHTPRRAARPPLRAA